MDRLLHRLSDRQLALLLGELNEGREGMASRVICEVSYRLLRASGSAMSKYEDELLDDLMTCEFRLRENNRRRRRETRLQMPGGRRAPSQPEATQKRVASVIPFR
jgi:hypothetical protein